MPADTAASSPIETVDASSRAPIALLDTAGSEPQTAGSEPQTAGSEPQTAGSEPQTAGSEPQTAGSEPQTAGSEPQTAGGKPQTAGWKPRHLLSTFSDRRSLRKIGGLGAYLTQVRWSLRWALRHRTR